MKGIDKRFTDLLWNTPEKPSKHLMKCIDSKMFPLDQNKVYSHKPEILAFTEYNRCLSLYQKRNPGLPTTQALARLLGVTTMIAKLETAHQEKLVDLAVNTMRELYQVPDYVDIKGMISPRLDLDTEQDDNPIPFLELTLEQKNKMRDEIQKRIILNGLVHGSSIHIWKSIYYLVEPELNSLDPNLKELYDYYTSNIGIILWLISPAALSLMIEENTKITQGFNKLEFNRGEDEFGGKINAAGINFPVLIHEINKGIMDWLISRALPKGYTEAEMTYFMSKADAYENEPWHYLLSPSLWTGLLDSAQIDSKELPRLISRLTQFSYKDLADLFILIQDKPEEAKQKIKRLI